jgi:hypothetical protein
MALDGLLALVCASLVISAGPPGSGSAAPGEDRDGALAAALAVQTALQQGRDHYLRGDHQAAVYTLESQLPRINGNRAYLAQLREAYRAYIKDLRLANNETAAQLYLQRLLILDPGAALDAKVRSANAPASTPAPPAVPPAVGENLGPKPSGKAGPPPAAPALPAAAVPKPAATAPAKAVPTVRGNIDEDDPFRSSREAVPKANPGRDLMARAEQEFGNRRYREARLLYDQAHLADPSVTTDSRERWAYCMLYSVVEQLNQPGLAQATLNDLEREVQGALELAPRLEYGKTLLGEIHKRRGRLAAAATSPQGEAAPSAVPVRHSERAVQGWQVAETANFRIYHNQKREVAELAGRAAERTRAEMYRKWFGSSPEPWNPKCDLFLHATAQAYSQVTRTPSNSPGHSTISTTGSQVVKRQIDLHCDDPNMLTAVLPHETTHVVLAGQFGDRPVPRWADEGMAVLAEPREKVERHLRNLARCRQEGQVFNARQLMLLDEYPDPRFITAFYAQSVSLVEFLANLRGPQTFALFLRDALRGGYEPALQRHYSFRSFAELQQSWTQYAFREFTPAGTGLARGSR